MKQPKPRPGILPIISQPKKTEPSWDGIDPAVRTEYEIRIAAEEARLADPEIQAALTSAVAAAQTALPPWELDNATPPSPQIEQRPLGLTRKDMAKLRDLRRKAEKLAVVVRSGAFDDWIRRFVVTADRPDEWTQAQDLYESYLRQAKNYGNNRSDRATSKQELATFTMWGKMMGSLFAKKRRGSGQFYPLRLKQGA